MIESESLHVQTALVNMLKLVYMLRPHDPFDVEGHELEGEWAAEVCISFD